jgi:hypothetical protein
MTKKTILPFALLLSSLTWGQKPASPSQSEALNQLESASATTEKPATISTPKDDAQKSKESPEQQKKTQKPASDPLSQVAANVSAQPIVPATALSNDQLLLQDRTIYVISNSFFVKKEQLETGLIQRKELSDWGFHVVQDPKSADLILSVRRAPFQNNFPFTFTDRASGIVVLGGTVNSLFGTVPGKIAGRLADRIKEINKKQ